ncbi:S8 family serine peptidase [Natrinema sp. SYSU A 869]|uniref:S8 family serine peptidase n=1 Tax=Natrinema sp. SYSU A 869 TaxID=2871694 RepID=UPI001CA41BB1|nr:S8 family serine peptidase [Natrinema sp. SYSU A 869]
MNQLGGRSRRSVLKRVVEGGIVLGSVGAVSAGDRSVPADQEVYVVLAGDSELRGRIERAGFEILNELADGSIFIVQGAAEKAAELRAAAVAIELVPNETFVLDTMEAAATDGESGDEPEPLYEDQWDKQLTRAQAAHDRATGEGATLAVIDSGVSHSHPDLEPRLDADRGRLFRNGHVHTGVGEVTVAEESSLLLQPTKTATRPVAADVYGHGSHVAGIAAAPRNDAGIVGMAPDATIVPLRPAFYKDATDVYDELSDIDEEYGVLVTTIADMLLAIDYAVEIGVDVINLSLRKVWPGDSRSFAAFRRIASHAIEQGTVVVAAAGNEMVDLDHDSRYFLPAGIPDAITVAATGPTDKRSHYSNYGDGTIDVAAPGGGYETLDKTMSEEPARVEYPAPTNYVLSSVPEEIYGRQYEYFSGTSMAAPQVAGLACLLRELAPDLHPRRVEQAITESAVDLSGEYTSGLGTGRIDAPAAIDRISDRV